MCELRIQTERFFDAFKIAIAISCPLTLLTHDAVVLNVVKNDISGITAA